MEGGEGRAEERLLLSSLWRGGRANGDICFYFSYNILNGGRF